MNRDDVLQVLRSHGDDFHRLGVNRLALFGSVARDEATPASDVDILVEFDRPAGIFQLERLQQFLESLLGRSVDVGTLNSLKPSIRSRVLSEAINVS